MSRSSSGPMRSLPSSRAVANALRTAPSATSGNPTRAGRRPVARFGGANGVMDKIHKRHMAGPLWELLIVGADRQLPGRGRGSALVRDGLARADEGAAVLPQHTEPLILQTVDLRGDGTMGGWANRSRT